MTKAVRLCGNGYSKADPHWWCLSRRGPAIVYWTGFLMNIVMPMPRSIPAKRALLPKQQAGLVKTDRADAIVLASMGAALQPRSSQVKSQALQKRGGLIMARRALVKDKTAVKNRLHTLKQPVLKRLASRRLKQVKANIETIDQACRDVVAADPELSRRRAILTSIPGIGGITALAMLAEMPELGAMNKRQTAALAGLAPVTRQSGAWRGRSFIQGGRKPLRDALCMPALIAARFNPQLKPVYRRMRKVGKPAKVAITAIMRRLIICANATLRDNRKGTKQPLEQHRYSRAGVPLFTGHAGHWAWARMNSRGGAS